MERIQAWSGGSNPRARLIFDANGGLFETLLEPEDVIISDELNHASIIDGVRLCKAARFRYRNSDMAELEAQFRVLTIAQTNSVARLALQPKSASARRFMTELQISFRTDNFSPVSTALTFSDGSSMRNDFTNAVVNPLIAPGLFDPKMEPDFSVVEPMRN